MRNRRGARSGRLHSAARPSGGRVWRRDFTCAFLRPGEFKAAPGGDKVIDGEVPSFAVNAQLEPVLQERLEHEEELQSAGVAAGFAFDLEAAIPDPRRAAHDLERLHPLP